MSDISPLVGWYESSDQPSDRPTYDPPHDGPCLVCWQPLTDDTVRTVGVMYEDRRGGISLFYRLHRRCHDGLTPGEQEAYDASVLRVADERARA